MERSLARYVFEHLAAGSMRASKDAEWKAMPKDILIWRTPLDKIAGAITRCVREWGATRVTVSIRRWDRYRMMAQDPFSQLCTPVMTPAEVAAILRPVPHVAIYGMISGYQGWYRRSDWDYVWDPTEVVDPAEFDARSTDGILIAPEGLPIGAYWWVRFQEEYKILDGISIDYEPHVLPIFHLSDRAPWIGPFFQERPVVDGQGAPVLDGQGQPVMENYTPDGMPNQFAMWNNHWFWKDDDTRWVGRRVDTVVSITNGSTTITGSGFLDAGMAPRARVWLGEARANYAVYYDEHYWVDEVISNTELRVTRAVTQGTNASRSAVLMAPGSITNAQKRALRKAWWDNSNVLMGNVSRAVTARKWPGNRTPFVAVVPYQLALRNVEGSVIEQNFVGGGRKPADQMDFYPDGPSVEPCYLPFARYCDEVWPMCYRSNPVDALSREKGLVRSLLYLHEQMADAPPLTPGFTNQAAPPSSIDGREGAINGHFFLSGGGMQRSTLMMVPYLMSQYPKIRWSGLVGLHQYKGMLHLAPRENVS